MKKQTFTQHIKDFNFKSLFNDLGWDNFDNQLPIAVNEDAFMLKGVAVKRGFVILLCPPLPNGKIPLSNIRKQIENKVAKNYFEHLIIYADNDKNHQIWQLSIKEENKPKQVREVSWYSHQDVEGLFQRMKNLLFTLDEEEKITIVDVKQRISENFAKNSEQVTKKFYTEFKKQHVAFLDFIQGIDDHIGNKDNQNKQWYASLMLNRLMFCYFIQKKGFLDQDLNYLQNKLAACEKLDGQGNFYSFYRSFLLELFHDGLGKPQTKRKSKLPVDLGKIPYLNGGLFDVHELERQFDQIEIQDDAFKKIFSFFDQWNWHLDNSIEASGKDINPDVIGYIFEKYINDRAAMGAYYTKEDITDYIGKNTIIPFLFDETERHYKEGFKGDSELWQFLKDSSTNYIYDAVKKGVPEKGGLFDDLPDDVKAGINHPLENEIVQAKTKPHLWEIRQTWNQKTPEDIGLPTEIYRELIERRKRFTDVKEKIEKGEITQINDFITYNLNIRQFTQDYIESTGDAAFIRYFYKAIHKTTILDPTCGSGAFLFAALNILEPLYEACITRMEQFVAEQPGKHKFFEEVLAEVNSDKHPSLQYFILKSIILNNLYGVDIMHEAVEIAKLRLFLKLVATVDVNPRKENFGLEPLPDIDFNIRAGNTLIGFATETELLRAVQVDQHGQYRAGYEQELKEFKEECELVAKAFSHFQNSQLINDQGSESFKQAKRQLVEKLKDLNHKLNVYLASNYGITDLKKDVEIEVIDDAKKKIKIKVNQYQHWLQSHQPFHWFAEFYQIVAANGGFDCIIGNPPYVGYTRKNKVTKRAVSDIYRIYGYETLPTSNLYPFTIERSRKLMSTSSKIGMIIPNSAFANNSMEALQKFFREQFELNYISTFHQRPAQLFEGVLQRLCIFISIPNTNIEFNSSFITTDIIRWTSNTRNVLFEKLSYIEARQDKQINLINIGCSVEKLIFDKFSEHSSIAKYLSKTPSNNKIYYRTAGGGYWVTILNTPFDSESLSNKSSIFQENYSSKVFSAVLNSSLFWWYYCINFDLFNFKDYMIFGFFFDYPKDDNSLKLLSDEMEVSLQNNATYYTINSTTRGANETVTYNKDLTKPIMDKIDSVLAEHYGFTECELDFIINYDIKYRMGKSLFGETDDETEEDEN
jgi:hypothetical protein